MEKTILIQKTQTSQNTEPSVKPVSTTQSWLTMFFLFGGAGTALIGVVNQWMPLVATGAFCVVAGIASWSLLPKQVKIE